MLTTIVNDDYNNFVIILNQLVNKEAPFKPVGTKKMCLRRVQLM